MAATTVFDPSSLFSSSLLSSSFLGCKTGISSSRLVCRKNGRKLHPRVAAVQKSEHDVVVVGAGVIGLTIAREFLLRSDLSVAVVDARVPCSGATGAGQGYIWMGHKTPSSDVWALSTRSKQLWEDLAESLEQHGSSALQVLGWKKTGSLLVGRTSKEVALLEERVKIFNDAGLRAEFLSATDLHSKEPDIDVGEEGGAARFPDDCQLDAIKSISFIQKENRYYSSEGRYSEFYNNPVIGLSSKHGKVEAVQTSKNILHGRKAVIIAAGSWSGTFMRSIFKSDNVPDVLVEPRKGHLLVLENTGNIQLNYGIMEMGYIDHVSTRTGLSKSNMHNISFTATMDTVGNLVLGSSRQFCGFDAEVDNSIVKGIWDRAGIFLPSLRMLSFGAFQKKVKTGLRPWMPDGRPIIGPVPGLQQVLLATGHEGGGLCMALGTAEIVADMVLGDTMKVNNAPFSLTRQS